ncbi:MAG: SAM-dependent methyltransferase [Desulfosoma sp.]
MIPPAAVFTLSCAALGFEVLLVRILHIAHDHHFAFMILSLALLGYGAGGTALTLTQGVLMRRPAASFAALAVLFSCAVLLAPALVRDVPFNPLEILWDGRQTLRLSQVYLILSIPFFLAGTAVGLAFRSFPERIPRLYVADLCGAAAGAALAVGLLHVLKPGTSLRFLSAAGALSAAVCWMAVLRHRKPQDPAFRPVRPVRGTGAIPEDKGRAGGRHGGCVFFGVLGAAVILVMQALVPHGALAPKPFEYKGLAHALKIPGVRLLAERSGPMGWLVLAENPRVPFRGAPGLSLSCPAPVPAQLGLFTDGDGPAPVLPRSPNPGHTAFLDCLMGALPYRLASGNKGPSGDRRCLILGLGGGLDAAVAEREGMTAIHVVERNRDAADLVRAFGRDGDGDGGSSGMIVHIMDPRRFLETTTQTFHVIQLSAVGALSFSGTGGVSLLEVYDATVEAFQRSLDRLAPGGILALVHALSVPPQATLRFVLTAAEALKRRGVADVRGRIAVIRHWNTALLLVKNGVFTQGERDDIRRFCRERSFDLAYLPGMAADEAERFHKSPSGSLHEALSALLGPPLEEFHSDWGDGARLEPTQDKGPSGARPLRETNPMEGGSLDERVLRFSKNYPFRIDPATDDRPYAFQFFKYATFRTLHAERHGRGIPLIQWGVPVLAATLVQALAAAVLLILAPLGILRRRRLQGEAIPAWKTAAYFGGLGLAFLFVETAAIQKNVLLLGHPVYGFAGTVASFLLWAGLGSLAAPRWAHRMERVRFLPCRNVLSVTAVCAGLAGLAYGWGWSWAVSRLLSFPDAVRWAGAVLCAAPAAFWMGMPFPLGLRALSGRRPELVPWAWAINGCASVLSALLAALAAVTWGFSALFAAAALFYLLAALCAPSR